ncbi:hypothetical protein [Clostridium rectalis]|uniref:hypothetical protein n=1 Tax=Clostridium rectalis TaxID=2040295 RepID=UPI000F633AB9|nr:hypothetical protein [Clostridium rectalis]
MINYNEYMINKYKNMPKIIKDIVEKYEEESCICMCYREEFLSKIHVKYNVDINLIKELIESDTIAIEENKKADIRTKELEQEKETREKIDLYKRAILELKQDDKI